MPLLQELKRRNVIRVSIAYAVVAWLVLQVADIVLNNVEAPSWAFWLILLILGIGFVIVAVFSWVFELTPEGLKREREVDRSQSITSHTGKKLDHVIIGVLVLALGYFVFDKFVLSASRESAAVEAALHDATDAARQPVDNQAGETGPSIAVLPFVNMSEDASNEYFSDGISEEILNALARVRELKVAGRTSSFAFKGKNQDLRTIGEALGVEHILEGSVRKAGDQVRITAQLIKVDDGFHLWSDTYDRRLDDVFAIQDEIATAILQEMKTTLLDEAGSLVSATRTTAEAYERYLLARQRIYDRTELSLKDAVDLLDRAIAIDPEYAPAYAQRGIATLLLSETSYGTIPSAEALTRARPFLERALELDPELAEGWAGMGLYYNDRSNQPQKAIEVLKKALSLNPNLIDAGNWLVLSYWGVNRASEAMALLDELTERDPLYKPAFGNRVFLLSAMGRGEQARTYIDSIEPFMPDEAQILQARAWVDEAQGRAAASLRRMQAALEKQPTDRVFRVGVNVGHFQTQQFERVFDDRFSGVFENALLMLDREEEAVISARELAAQGRVDILLHAYNVLDRPAEAVAYIEQRWESLDDLQRDHPPFAFGDHVMLNVAHAYHRTGREERFQDALARLTSATRASLEQGVVSHFLLAIAASAHALAGQNSQALEYLARAVDSGFLTSARIARMWPAFRDLEGDPEYEMIQQRMVDRINRQREMLGLDPLEA